MKPGKAIVESIRNTFLRSGKSNRAKFWWFATLWTALSNSLRLYFGRFVEAVAGFNVRFISFLGNSFPVISADIRRLTDAGNYPARASNVGWGFSGMLTGPWLYSLRGSFVPLNFQRRIVPGMISASQIGMAAMITALSTPSKLDPTKIEV